MHSAFERAVNLVAPDGTVLTLADPSLGTGPRAVGVHAPCALGLAPGDAVTLGTDALGTPHGSVPVPTRVVDHAVPALAPRPEAVAAVQHLVRRTATAPLGSWEERTARTLTDRLAALVDALTARDDDRVDRAVAALVGLGHGLTPTGDDMLCGLLLATHLPSPAAAYRTTLVTAVRAHHGATVPLSATFLEDACGGRARSQALDLVHALHTGSHVTDAVHAVLSIGHSSGHDLLTGLVAGLTGLVDSRLTEGTA